MFRKKNSKRHRNAKCPECGLEFASRRARHGHQMHNHRIPRVGPTKRKLRLAFSRRQRGLNNA